MVWPDSIALLNDLKNEDVLPVLQFQYLPSYAQFLLKNKVSEFAQQQLKLVRSMKVPLFRYFESLAEEQLVQRGEIAAKKMLAFLARNNAREFIRESVQGWLSNQLPLISREQIVAEDISLISFIRRKTMRDFLSAYSEDPEVFRNVMEEVDRFTTELDTICFKTLLLLQQDLYKQTQELAHIGHWEWNLVTGKLTWSDELYRIYEFDPNKPVSADIARLNHPDDAALVTEQMKRSRETMEPHDFYYRVILDSGVEKFLHAKGRVQIDEKGNAFKMFGTLQDVTAQKLIERELNEKQNFVEKITNITPSLITVYNMHTGQYIYVNRTLENILGHSSEEVLRKGVKFFMELIHPDDAPIIIQQNATALARANETVSDHEEIVEFLYRLRHRDGQYRWIRTYGTVFTRDKNNHVDNVINISIDVTRELRGADELKVRSEELRRNEERYHRMIDEVEDYAILRLSREGIVENWNRGAEKIKGYKADEIVGKSFRLFYTQADRDAKVPEKLLESALKNGKSTLEGWRVRKDGSHFWGNVVLTSLHDERNNVIGFTKVTRDLTERKAAEDLLRQHASMMEQKNYELAQKNKELESFSYIASHDLQEPLRKIMLFAKRIEEKDELSDTSKDYFNRIVAASLRMQSLIDALLNFASVNTYEDKYELTPLNDIVEEVKKDLSEAIEERQAKVDVAPLPVLNIIRLQFQQLFTNMIGNAIKYGRAGLEPHIQVTSQLVSSGTIDPNLPERQFYKISIADNGIGFEQQYAARIFEPFQRLHGRKDYSGAGIGLAICKKIVNNHDGFIDAVSEPGKGSTFNIYLPAL